MGTRFDRDAKPIDSPGGGMVDALVSGASAARRAGSSPVPGTQLNPKWLKINYLGFFFEISDYHLTTKSKIISFCPKNFSSDLIFFLR